MPNRFTFKISKRVGKCAATDVVAAAVVAEHVAPYATAFCAAVLRPAAAQDAFSSRLIEINQARARLGAAGIHRDKQFSIGSYRRRLGYADLTGHGVNALLRCCGDGSSKPFANARAMPKAIAVRRP